MTKDNELVVLHDHYLDRVKRQMADRYPDRAKKMAVTTLSTLPLRKLRTEIYRRFDIVDGKKSPKLSNRFPMGKSDFRTYFQKKFIYQGLNKSTGQDIGIYPEIKAPWFHEQEGKDIYQKYWKCLNSTVIRKKKKTDNVYSII